MEKIYLGKGSVIFNNACKEQVLLSETINFNSRYKENIEIFYKTLIDKGVVTNLDNFMRNIDNIKIYNKWMNVFNLFDGTMAEYDSKKNTISLYTPYLLETTFNHELLHVASSYYDKENDINYCGFFQENKSATLGDALNEGYTEYLNDKLFYIDISKTYYLYEMVVASLMEIIVGPNNMQKLYFDGDLYSLINILKKYNTLDGIRKFLLKMDFIMDNRDNMLLRNKVVKYIYDVNYFLVVSYTNKLLYLFNSGIISLIELEYLLGLFTCKLKKILDIKLPIRRRKLRNNIIDNREIALYKVKQRV